MRKILVALLVLSTEAFSAERLLTVGGGITEVVCALGSCDSIVAVDSSSTFPESVKKLPQVGYARALNVEGVLAQKPTLVILGEEAGPPEVIRKLEAMKVPLARIKENHSLEGSFDRIRGVAAALNKKAEGEALVKSIDTQLQTLKKTFAQGKKPKVLFLYARGAKLMQVAGGETTADTMISLMGAENAAKDVKGYKPFTSEAIAAANPDVILMTDKGAESLGGAEKVFELPGMKLTQAFAKKRLVTEEDLRFLSIGPRTPDVVKGLNAKISGGH